MSATTAPPGVLATEAGGVREINPWWVTAAVMMAVFMEVLDTTIVNVSLPHIAGNLSASVDESTWVLTSYLVANAIILPMTGWLANHFGRKRILMSSIIGFTLASVACGMAPNLSSLIFFRVVQGATGGGLQPLSQAIMLEAFPGKKRGKAMAIWALGIVVAPMLGPMLGGWITDSYSWRWIFYINLPVGLLATMMSQWFIFDPPYIKRSSDVVDYWGIGFLIVGIGSLQVMLDKGQEDDWFGSHFITTLAVLTVVGLILFIMRELMAEHPIVDLRVFRVRTYATGVFLMTILGFVLYGSTVLIPIWLQTLMGYSSLEAGFAVLPRGLGSFLFMPLVGVLMGFVEPRKLLATGLITAGGSLYFLSLLNTQAGYWDFFWPQLIQGAAMGLLFVPLTTITNDPIAPENMGNATSIFNLMRNIGGSIGIAMTTTIVARSQQLHYNNLVHNMSSYNPKVQQMMAGARGMFMSKGMDAHSAGLQAYHSLWGMVMQQAMMLSFIRAFQILSGLFFICLPLILLMRKPKHNEKGGGGMAH
ncbi:Drug resistance transporter EmrB/QacA subfamily [Candidatus Koribacter versatilis Ellin345]|uniref:Drug resistance transporter EmrB/QacA subfamily n=1 Tax=Koribacter versatilis (strain Ellin345) TaxID=204669 RepID=Q1IM05_KORVE|nr:DHA2 family efflux MFS transporter permease subunit [Candidatus Koribacter versatilis]ABF42095.1 Drug resistance transporter EmrB/QacA subfamily [Candidatus Koribacter versatilis Ellin345]